MFTHCFFILHLVYRQNKTRYSTSIKRGFLKQMFIKRQLQISNLNPSTLLQKMHSSKWAKNTCHAFGRWSERIKGFSINVYTSPAVEQDLNEFISTNYLCMPGIEAGSIIKEPLVREHQSSQRKSCKDEEDRVNWISKNKMEKISVVYLRFLVKFDTLLHSQICLHSARAFLV